MYQKWYIVSQEGNKGGGVAMTLPSQSIRGKPDVSRDRVKMKWKLLKIISDICICFKFDWFEHMNTTFLKIKCFVKIKIDFISLDYTVYICWITIKEKKNVNAWETQNV